MMPIVDPQVQLWSEHLADGIEPCTLQSILSQSRHVHVLRAVQVSPARDTAGSSDEAAWIEAIATTPGSGGLPNALVAAIELAHPAVTATVRSLASLARIRGVRPVVRDRLSALEERPQPATSDHSEDIFEQLAAFGLLLDLSVERRHLPAVANLAKRYPSLSIVISGAGSAFFPGLPSSLAACDNISLKLCGFGASGAVQRSIDALIDRMGVERVMFASGYPVRHRQQDYDDIWQGHAVATMHRSASERDALFRNNAMRHYRL